MHPTAIILIFTFLALMILAGVVLSFKSGRSMIYRFADRRTKLSGFLVQGFSGVFGIALVAVAARGIFRLISTG